jgi:hypothetical protein
MKKLLLSVVVAASLTTLPSCSITLPVAATSNPIGSKVGQQSADIFLGVLCFDGDASIKTAAKNGGISKVSTVDIKTFNVLGIYQKVTTIVTGE